MRTRKIAFHAYLEKDHEYHFPILGKEKSSA